MRLFYFLFFLIAFSIAKGQLNSPNVICSSGFYFSNSTFSNSYSIGEMCLVETVNINSDLITQGFQQPDYEIEVIDEDCVIPNGFSPNNDGYNDYWEIPCLKDYSDATVKIFNRWGQELFSAQSNIKSWDGNFNGQPLPIADYYYVILIEKLNKKLTGTVTLKR